MTKKMAKVVKNPKGFKVIKIDREELVGRLAEYGSVGVCDDCGLPTDSGYYIAVLNQWFCPSCYKEWTERAKRYKEDEVIEDRNFELYKQIFEI